MVSPALFREDGATGFLRNFFAGLMTTAGLSSNIGGPSQDGDQRFGLHGRISYIAAEDIGNFQQWKDDAYEIRVAGAVRQATVFGECLVLRREIVTRLGSNALTVRDVVENAAFIVRAADAALSLQLRLSDAQRRHPPAHVRRRRRAAGRLGGAGLAEHDRFGEPQKGYAEQCFYHRLNARDGRAYAALFNEALGMGAYVRFRTDTLPYLVEWKMMGEQEYVVRAGAVQRPVSTPMSSMCAAMRRPCWRRARRAALKSRSAPCRTAPLWTRSDEQRLVDRGFGANSFPRRSGARRASAAGDARLDFPPRSAASQPRQPP